MSNPNRDTQFAGFAHLLWQKIADRINALDDECNRTEEVVDGCVMCNLKPERIAAVIEPILARAGYDLVMHAFETVDSSIYKRWLSGENIPLFDALVDTIPDIAELPEENNTSTD